MEVPGGWAETGCRPSVRQKPSASPRRRARECIVTATAVPLIRISSGSSTASPPPCSTIRRRKKKAAGGARRIPSSQQPGRAAEGEREARQLEAARRVSAGEEGARPDHRVGRVARRFPRPHEQGTLRRCEAERPSSSWRSRLALRPGIAGASSAGEPKRYRVALVIEPVGAEGLLMLPTSGFRRAVRELSVEGTVITLPARVNQVSGLRRRRTAALRPHPVGADHTVCPARRWPASFPTRGSRRPTPVGATHRSGFRRTFAASRSESRRSASSSAISPG